MTRMCNAHTNDMHEQLSASQSCPIIGNPRDYSLPGSSIHGIFQARILEWVAISYSSGSF